MKIKALRARCTFHPCPLVAVEGGGTQHVATARVAGVDHQLIEHILAVHGMVLRLERQAQAHRYHEYVTTPFHRHQPNLKSTTNRLNRH